jgi:predicted ATP-grasp superfamily ATP-dependent carboligase
MSTGRSRENMPWACLLGDISMVRALGKSGIPVAIATADTSDKSVHSRYCKEVVDVPGWAKDPAATFSALTGWAENQDAKPVLFYQTDTDLLWISRFESQLAKYFRFVIPDSELVLDLVDKSRFFARAGNCGIPIPPTAIISDTRSFREQIDNWSSFPCILKPITRTDAWHRILSKDKKALHINSHDELTSVLERLQDESAALILQSLVRGGEENVLSYHAYVGKDQEVLVEFTGAKIRTSPRQFGFSTYLEITDDQTVRDLGRDIVKNLGFYGVLKIDFKRDDESGRLYVLEINPRFNLWHHPGVIAGAPIPAVVYWDCVDPARIPRFTKARSGVRWMRPRSDLRSFSEYRSANELSTIKWLYQAIAVDVNEGFEISDLGPVVHDVLDILRTRRISGNTTADKSCRSH